MPVFALINGLETELQKDCSCADHDGPHWLAANNRWHVRNQRIDTQTVLGVMAKAREETARLADKAYHFKRLGIESLITA